MDYSREDMIGLRSLNFDMPHFNEEGLLQLQEESYEGIGELDPFKRIDRQVAVSCMGYRVMRRLRVWDGCVWRVYRLSIVVAQAETSSALVVGGQG